tara:strand:- start:246 stop:395 length:150 start_codon:yes stop_codon:yes gene_type:complete
MIVNLKTYSIWLIGIILWNFGFPGAMPIADVSVAIVLSIATSRLNRVLK